MAVEVGTCYRRLRRNICHPLMNRTALLAGLGSFALGALLVYLLMRPASEPTEVIVAPITVVDPAPKVEPKGQEAEPAKPEAKEEPAKLSFANSPAQMEEIQKKMREGMAEQMRLKVEERLAALKTRVSLTPEQVEKLRPVVERILADPNQLPLDAALGSGSVILTGEKLKEHQESIRADRAKAEEELLGMLEGTQQAAYQEWKKDDRTNRVEARANQELAQLQSQLSLTSEQKDKAFALLSKLAEQEIDEPGGLTGLERFQQRRNSRIEGMREILTEEQLAVYQRQGAAGAINISVGGLGGIGGAAAVSGDGAASVQVIEVHADATAIPAAPPPGEKK